VDVASLDERFEEQAAAIENLSKRIDGILSQLSEASTAKPSPPVWHKFVAAVLPGLVIGAIGIYTARAITGVVEEQRLELAHLAAMMETMGKLSDDDTTVDEAKAAGLLLGAFGSRAVVPLLSELSAPGGNRALAAREGLRVAAFKDGERTCEVLTRVLENRTGLFDSRTHGEIVRVLGEVAYQDAIPILEELGNQLGTRGNPNREGREQYKTRVRSNLDLDDKAMDSLGAEITEALRKIRSVEQG
jgi:hypothetical protein